MATLTIRLTTGLALVGALGLAVIVGLTVVNAAGFVLDRLVEPFGGNVPGLSGYEELVQLLVGPAALCFFPYCMVKRGHVSVALVSYFFPSALHRGMERLSDFTMGLLALFLAWMLTLGAVQSRTDGIMTPVLGLAEWPFQLICVAALLVWATVAFHMMLTPNLFSGPDTDG